MALEFKLADGTLQHMTMLNTPIFGAKDPRTFFNLMVATRPDPATGRPNPEKIKAFEQSHPDNLDHANFLANNNPPGSYANSAYFGIHAFKFSNRDNVTTWVKWHFLPQDGERLLSESEMKTVPPDFLEAALIKRTQSGNIKWDMMVVVGEPGDVLDNSTIAWPTERRQIKMGTLSITAAMPQAGAACEEINYDPLVMSDGIEPGNDPILLFRSSAYMISHAKRLSEK